MSTTNARRRIINELNDDSVPARKKTTAGDASGTAKKRASSSFTVKPKKLPPNFAENVLDFEL